MPTSVQVGFVSGLWRFPVKSMAGERLEQAELTERGLLGDRAYALIDADTGKVVSAKSVKLFPGMLDCRAGFVEPPRADGELPAVRITLPDGSSATSDSSRVDGVLSAYFGRDVTLARAAPDDYTIDMYHPDVENIDPAGYRDTFVEQKLGSAFFAEAGVDSPVPVGSLFDLFPVSVLTTLAQDDLSKDTEVLRTLAQHNRIDVGTAGRFPCAGVYAVVEAPGSMRVGDSVALTEG